MEELLARFELTDIIIMLTLLIVGAEKLIKAIDWFRARFRKDRYTKSRLVYLLVYLFSDNM